jgi:adenylate cyclase
LSGLTLPGDLAGATVDPSAGEALTTWLVAEGLRCDDLRTILHGLCTRLTAAGVRLARGFVALPTLHPDIEGFSCVWRPQASALLDSYEHGGETRPGWLHSAVRHSVENTLPFARWRVDDPAVLRRFPLLVEFRAEGLTDYIILLERFGREEASIALRGTAITWATDRAEGFSDAEVALLQRVSPALALAVYGLAMRNAAVNLVDSYLGRDAGRRILAGQVRRGSVERIHAVVLFADLRGFTALADRTPAETLVAWLNDYLAAIVDEIDARGGEVLKFLGDGLLALFPLVPGAADEPTAHGRAIDAARAALVRVEALNRARTEAGLPTMALDIVLHQGEVMYGNVGAARRLDFTIIGPTVNEAARMEALCGSLGVSLLLSAPVAEACGRPLVPLGEHALRGVEAPRALFTLDERA